MYTPDGKPPAPPALAASFEFTPVAPTEGDVAQFADTSTGNVSRWTWLIDDVPVSSTRGATYRFENAGAFTVTLIVSSGDDSQTASRVIRVSNQVITFYSYKGGTGRSMA